MEGGTVGQAAEAFSQSVTANPISKVLSFPVSATRTWVRLTEAIVPLAAATALNEQSRSPALLAEVFEKLGDRDDAIAMARLAIEPSANNQRERCS